MKKIPIYTERIKLDDMAQKSIKIRELQPWNYLIYKMKKDFAKESKFGIIYK